MMYAFAVEKQRERKPIFVCIFAYMIKVCNAKRLIRGFVILYGTFRGFLQPPSGKQTVRNVNTESVKAASDLSVVELTVKYSSETNYKKCHLKLFYPIGDIQYAIQFIIKIQTLE
jgi:hypothetical protein